MLLTLKTSNLRKIVIDKYERNKPVVFDFFWRSIQIFSKQVVTFLIFIFCAKTLEPNQFGIYSYVLAIVSFLVMFSDFGVSTATSKYTAEYSVSNRKKLKIILFNSLFIILLVSLLITLAVLFFGKSYLGDKYTYVLYLLPMVFLSPATSVYDGLYRGLKKFRSLSMLSILTSLMSLPLVFILVNKLGLVGAMISQNIFYFLLLISLALNYKNFSISIETDVIKKIGSYSLIFGFASVGYYLFSRIDILILGKFNYFNEISVYEVMNKIMSIFLLPFSIFGQILAPNITVLYTKNKKALIKKKYGRTIIRILNISILYIFLIAALIPLLVNLFFHKYYGDSFYLMLPPVLAIYFTTFINSSLNAGFIVATGHASLMTKLNVFLGIFNLVLSLFMVKSFGYIGVVYATAIANLVGTLILHFTYFKVIKEYEK